MPLIKASDQPLTETLSTRHSVSYNWETSVSFNKAPPSTLPLGECHPASFNHPPPLPSQYLSTRWVCVLVSQLCLTLCSPMDCSLSGFSIHGISQARNTGVDCHFLLQEVSRRHRIEPGSPALQAHSLGNFQLPPPLPTLLLEYLSAGRGQIHALPPNKTQDHQPIWETWEPGET